jgi:hypothetical protein
MHNPGPTIPLVIDSIKRSGPPLCRCVYHTVECDEPAAGWHMSIEDKSYPILMLGLSGVIYLSADGTIFSSPRKIEDVFNAIESDPRLYVDNQDIWLPSALFDQFPPETFARQSVFRVGMELFRLALLHRQAHIRTQEFIERATGHAESVTYSEAETWAFKNWVESIISETRELKPQMERLPRKSMLPPEPRGTAI